MPVMLLCLWFVNRLANYYDWGHYTICILTSLVVIYFSFLYRINTPCFSIFCTTTSMAVKQVQRNSVCLPEQYFQK